MSKNINTGQRASRQPKPIKKIVERYYVGTEKMETEIAERLNLQLSANKEQLSSIEQFAEQMSGYAGITKLNFKIINQLIEKILVSEPVDIDGRKFNDLLSITNS